MSEETEVLDAVTSEEQAAETPAEQPAKDEAATSEMSPEEKAELFDRIEEAEDKARDAKRKMEHAKVVYKAAKEDYEAAVAEVHVLAGAGKEEFPLLDGQTHDDAVKEAAEHLQETADTHNVSVTLATSGESVTIDPKWRRMGICAAGLSATEDEMLTEAGIATMGELVDAIHAGTTIKGVNGNYRTRIENKVKGYLKEIHAD